MRIPKGVALPFGLLLASVTGLAQQGAVPVPNAGNYARWLEFIRPSADELAFEAIGWRSEFWPAVEEARELGRPILLWTMNGHPLGCT